ncbi:ciliary microtubule inner protein 2B [Stigmatopora nigra]
MIRLRGFRTTPSTRLPSYLSGELPMYVYSHFTVTLIESKLQPSPPGLPSIVYRHQLHRKEINFMARMMGDLRNSVLGSGSAGSLRTIPERHAGRILPGYTGFIPKRQNYIACSYSETCQRAFSDFYQEMYANIHQTSTDPSLAVNSTQQQPKIQGQMAPLTEVLDKVVSYHPSTFAKPLDDDQPSKYYMSGFTGHVPKYRFLFGKGYPIATNEALVKSGKQQRDDGDHLNPSIRTIYQSQHKGVVPSFTGHIPGYKFMHGHTFGRLSKKALEKNATGKSNIKNNEKKRAFHKSFSS